MSPSVLVRVSEVERDQWRTVSRKRRTVVSGASRKYHRHPWLIALVTADQSRADVESLIEEVNPGREEHSLVGLAIYQLLVVDPRLVAGHPGRDHVLHRCPANGVLGRDLGHLGLACRAPGCATEHCVGQARRVVDRGQGHRGPLRDRVGRILDRRGEL